MIPVLAALVLGVGHPNEIMPQSLEIEEVWRDSGPAVSMGLGGAVVDDQLVLLEGPGAEEVVAVELMSGERRSMPVSLGGQPQFLGPATEGFAVLESNAIRVFTISEDQAEEVRSFPVLDQTFFPKGLVAGSRTALLAAGLAGSNKGLHAIDPSGEVVASALENPDVHDDVPHPSPDRVGRMVAGGPLTKSGEDVLFSGADSHLVAEADPETAALDTIRRDTSVLPSTGGDFREADGYRWWFPRGAGAAPLENGRVLNAVRFAEEGWTLWELYDRDGSLVDRVRLDGSYEVWGLTEDNDIVATVLLEDSGDPYPMEAVPVLLRAETGIP